MKTIVFESIVIEPMFVIESITGEIGDYKDKQLNENKTILIMKLRII